VFQGSRVTPTQARVIPRVAPRRYFFKVTRPLDQAVQALWINAMKKAEPFGARLSLRTVRPHSQSHEPLLFDASSRGVCFFSCTSLLFGR